MTKNFFKWLYPRMGIKRWLFVALLGVIVVGFGAVMSAHIYRFVNVLGFVWILCGIVLIVMGMSKVIVSLLTLFLPQGEQDLINILYQRRYLERGPKIVILGGGHGLSNLIFGLKEYTSNITAVVTVADSGGSSGRLREEFNIVAPGDIRNCLVALADAPKLMGDLFQYRFAPDSQLQGHNFGNLFLTAMYHVTDEDFERAVNETSKVLAIRGKVVPATTSNVHLIAEYRDGTKTKGEAKIPDSKKGIRRLSLTDVNAKPTQAALDAIQAADVIVLGPGSLYTSVIPNLIIYGMSEAIERSSAFKVYVCNVMTQPGESDGYTAWDHLKAIIDHAGPQVVDACLLNNAPVPLEALQRYQEQGQFPVAVDAEKIREKGYAVFQADLIGVADYVRHDSQKLNKTLIRLIEMHRVIKR
ncbi:MAG: YvcK family protein [Candidatus Omnitrophica bacterium]|nr:YvcK family protein [Candidatus Omnitrophota bacterium]